jgi:hypothetical protein
LILALAAPLSRADEGGVSFWAPGLYGSLASTPGNPGLSFALVYYHGKADAGADKQLTHGGRIIVGLEAKADILFFGPAYTFSGAVLGGQAGLSLTWVAGHVAGSVRASASGPLGDKFKTLDDERFAYGDLYPQATLKWNLGVHNFMAYVTGDIPVGVYDPDRLANLGIGHAAFDFGGGYTFFDPATGWEFSGTPGFTFNFTNTQTSYQNGVDFHLDLGASKFLSEQLHAGLVGYAYLQITGDSGSGAVLGDFKSRVFGLGPQVGFIFPAGPFQGYVNLKAYWEFAAQNRADGWNLWLTLAFSPAAPKGGT